MKRKLIMGIILIILISLSLCKVQAYSGELDPKNYITLPNSIYIKGGIGTGTVRLSSSASGYSIAYQKVNITESQKNTINNKNEAIKDYILSSKTTLQEKQANVQTLETEYETLVNSGTATNEQLTAAQTAYNEALSDYRSYSETVTERLTTLKNEFYSLIPNYTSSWTSTTNTTDNVKLDFKNFSGTAHFILWVKITNGTNTYYDMGWYSTTIEQEETVTISKSSAEVNVDKTIQLTASSSKGSNITWESSNNSIATVSSSGSVKGVKEGTAVITAKGSNKSATCKITVKSATANEPNHSGDLTDFSKAKFELKKDGNSKAIVHISNVTPKNDRKYYLLITSNANKPNITIDISDELIPLNYNENTKTLSTSKSDKVAYYVELNQNLYANIVEEKYIENEKVIAFYGKKLERFEEPKYSDAFHSTYMVHDSNQLVTNFTHAEKNNRKLHVKIGKITDVTILQKIKNKDSSGFTKLLSFAKSNNGIFDKIVDADKNDYYSIEYNAGRGSTTGKSVIKLSGLQNDAYYFLYVKAEGENGKYMSPEAVTLAQASVYKGGWGLFFYGSSDFKWADFGNVGTDGPDNTVAPGKIPQTGVNTIVWITLGLAVVGIGVFSYKKYKKYNFQ